VALPTLVLVLAVALAAVDLGIAEVRCIDAARLGARLLARGEAGAGVLLDVRAAAPSGARVSVAEDGRQVTVSVTGELSTALRRLGFVPPPTATAIARIEVPR
jgi:hypothetical protein